MKSLLIPALFLSQIARASYTRCPEHILTNKAYLTGISILNSIDTRINLGKCKIEIHTCRESSKPVDDDIVGDLLVTDKDGKQQYITLIFPKEGSASTKLKMTTTPLEMEYKYIDKNPDQIDGYKQKMEFKMELDPWTRKLKKLKIQTYSSNDHVNILGIIPVPHSTTCE